MSLTKDMRVTKSKNNDSIRGIVWVKLYHGAHLVHPYIKLVSYFINISFIITSQAFNNSLLLDIGLLKKEVKCS